MRCWSERKVQYFEDYTGNEVRRGKWARRGRGTSERKVGKKI